MKIKLLNLDLESTINLEEFAAKRRKFWGINLGNTSPEAAFFPGNTQKTFKTLFGSEQNPAANKKQPKKFRLRRAGRSIAVGV